MDHRAAEDYIRELYEHLLQRVPQDGELKMWTEHLVGTDDPIDLFRRMVGSKEYKSRTRIKTRFPTGHYYSPVVDPPAIEPYYRRSLASKVSDLRGIDVDVAAMATFWEDNLPTIRSSAFPFDARSTHRFRIDGAPFPWGDAVVLRAMIAARRPKRIIEIGSGFSTACMLDAADEFGLVGLGVTCIEPYPDSVRSLLWPRDQSRVRILESPVQEVPLDVFRELEAGDFLFVDSTHILKTGSDVHFELFEILPTLASGVVVHFHDCPFPFEYSPKWVLEYNHSWNEIYALRAYLTDNPCYRITFWNTLFQHLHPEKTAAAFPLAATNAFMRDPGSSIWLEKIATSCSR